MQWITCSGIILSAILSVILFFTLEESYVDVITSWMAVGAFNITWAIRVDTLSSIMFCVITVVSACVHIYSIGYMHDDVARGRFFSYLSLFTFAMLMLVSADNLVQLFFGWEGVGLASYLLIGFYNTKDSANSAAQKAFVANRVGDFGLALGIFAIFAVFGSVNFDDIFNAAPTYADAVMSVFKYDIHILTVIGLLLFIGAMGKSAQLGLHVWLPDAMEGPTPVSALIHAATMVTAGVFLVARFSPLYEYAPDALMVIAIMGGSTALIAATIGLTQFDIKRVIAYSTMSQLGYMFFALGVSAYSAAMFHLMTHAFFKALLFLGAGSVIHALHHEQDMRKMGGIWKKIPYTYAFMWIGSLALAGIPPFAGFYSKDIVLEAAWADQTWFGHYAFWTGIAAAFLTAFYSWRLILLTFHGSPKASQATMNHIHESPKVMLTPLFVLALGAIVSGFAFYQPFVGGAGHHDDAHAMEHVEPHAGDEAESVTQHGDEQVLWHSAPVKADPFWQGSIFVKPDNDTVTAAHNVPKWVKLLPLVMGLFGIFLAYVFYSWRPLWPSKVVRALKPAHTLIFNKYYFDELYQAIFIQNSKRLGAIFSHGDKHIVDAFGADGTAKASNATSKIISRIQSGFIYHYAFVMMVTVVMALGWFAVKLIIMGQGS